MEYRYVILIELWNMWKKKSIKEVFTGRSCHRESFDLMEYTYKCVYVSMYMYVYACMRVYVCVCMCVYVCVCMMWWQTNNNHASVIGEIRRTGFVCKMAFKLFLS